MESAIDINLTCPRSLTRRVPDGQDQTFESVNCHPGPG